MAFFQWLNQSYNAGVNWCNRSSGEGDVQSLATAYVAATGAALAIGVGGTALGKRAGGGIVRLTVPMLGVALSAVLNLVLTRRGPSCGGGGLRRIAAPPPPPLLPLPPAAGGRSWTGYLCTPPTGWSSASPRRRESSRSQSAPRCARAVLGTAGATDVPLLSTQRGPAPKTSAVAPFSQARILWTFLLLTVTPVLSGGALSALPSAISASPTGAMAVDLGATFACARARRPVVSGVSSHLQTAVDRRHLRLHLALCPARDGCVAAARHGGRLGARGAVPGPEG